MVAEPSQIDFLDDSAEAAANDAGADVNATSTATALTLSEGGKGATGVACKMGTCKMGTRSHFTRVKMGTSPFCTAGSTV